MHMANLIGGINETRKVCSAAGVRYHESVKRIPNTETHSVSLSTYLISEKYQF
jgi:hypothetical protein